MIIKWLMALNHFNQKSAYLANETCHTEHYCFAYPYFLLIMGILCTQAYQSRSGFHITKSNGPIL